MPIYKYADTQEVVQEALFKRRNNNVKVADNYNQRQTFNNLISGLESKKTDKQNTVNAYQSSIDNLNIANARSSADPRSEKIYANAARKFERAKSNAQRSLDRTAAREDKAFEKNAKEQSKRISQARDNAALIERDIKSLSNKVQKLQQELANTQSALQKKQNELVQFNKSSGLTEAAMKNINNVLNYIIESDSDQECEFKAYGDREVDSIPDSVAPNNADESPDAKEAEEDCCELSESTKLLIQTLRNMK